LVLSFYRSYVAHPALHSFPTRRSSDLAQRAIGIHRDFQHQPAFQAALPQFLGVVAVADALHSPTPVIEVGGVDHLAGVHRDQLRSEEHTSELQSRENLVCRLLLEKKKK